MSPDLDPRAGFITRLAAVGDAEQLADIHIDSWRSAYQDIVPPQVLQGLSLAARTQHWQEHLSQPPPATATFVVSNLDSIVGFATVGPARDLDAEPGYAELYSIYLRPYAWGSGAGRELLRVTLQSHPATMTWLWVLQANERAQRFYRRNGFQADGTERTHDFGDATLLEVRLARAGTDS